MPLRFSTVLIVLVALMAACATPAEPGGAEPAPVVEVEVTVPGPDTPVEEGDATADGDDPASALKAALESKDYAALEAMMTPSFGFGLIASEGVTYSPAEFVEQLQLTYLEPGAVQVDLSRDVRAEVGPDYRGLLDSYNRTVYSTGWGAGQADSALLFLDEQGQWAGMLYMFEGLETLLFAEGSGEPESAAVQPDEPATPAIEVNNTALGPFQDTLLAAITERRNYDVLQALMGDPFVIGYWQSEGTELAPSEAAALLEEELLPREAFVNYTLGGNLSGLLGGQDPLAMWGPDVNAQQAIHSTGWGSNGNSEAVLIIAQRPDGSYYWHGILYAPGGF
jgi:hypothetical protein